jgi:hypothetical protein
VHIKDSGRVVLGGFLVSAILPPLYQWWDTYHWNHKGLDEVTGGAWKSSLIGVGVWLVLVTMWHLMRAPIGHAREVLSARERHHAAEIERVRREAAPRIVTNVGEQHNHFHIGENLDPAAVAAVLKGGIVTEDLLRQISALGPRPTALDPGPTRPNQLQESQGETDRADDEPDDAGHAEPGQ